MSSTGRSDVRDPMDHYRTPQWAARVMVAHLPPLAGKRICEPSAGAGAIVSALIEGGATPSLITAIEPNVARAASLAALGVNVVTSTLEAYVAANPEVRFDIIASNPPFSLAEPHIDIMCRMLAPRDPEIHVGWAPTVAALVRLPFLAEGQCRAKFRREHPHDRVELVRRPSFTAEALPFLTEDELRALALPAKRPKAWKGEWVPRDETIAEVRARLSRTDSCAYAIGYFGEGRGGRFITHEETE